MLKTKVTCWFCSQDSQVFVFNKNSWTCAHCDQYNGFNKDGDYNKVIPEMHKENKSVKFCTSGSPPRSSNSSSCSNSSGGGGGGNSLLCDKCNQNQELKLTELNKFESKYDVEKSDKFEREYKLYKKKLDHVYDLCKPCKMRLDNHLRSIDQQIGDAYYVRNRTSTVVPSIMNGGSTSLTTLNPPTTTKTTNHAVVKPVENKQNSLVANIKSKGGPSVLDHDEPGYSICDNLKTTFQKAYTIAGTVPAYVFNGNGVATTTSPIKSSNQLRYRKHEIAPATTNDTTTRDYDSAMNSSRSKSPAEISATSTRFSCDSLLIVFEDLFALLFILMVCACDIVNLVNDSGVLLIEKNSSNEWYNSLLEIYKQVNLMLMFANVLAAHLFYKRPKLSRLLMFLGLAFDLLIHSQLAFDLKTEEQFISEAFISAFLAAYLVFARSYNVLQLIGIM